MDIRGCGRRLAPVVVFLLTLIAFLPALQNEFVTWDDDKNLIENPHYRGLGWTQLRWMFTTFHMNHYQPLSWMTLGLDYLLWGMEPFGYHLTNLLLHAGNAVLFYFVALRLFSLSMAFDFERLGVIIGAVLAALIFSVHPLRVESVAWVTERRDLLSAFFLFSALLFYLRAAQAEDGSAYRRSISGAIVVYAFSLLSKAAGMTFPAVLVVLDVYPLKRLGAGPGGWFGPQSRPIWWEKAPFFALGLVAGIVASIAQYQTGAMRTFTEHGITQRLAQALYGLAFYLWKTIVPVGLSPLYELPVHFNAWAWPILLGGLTTVGITLVLLAARQQWPAGLACWICYGVLLAPVLGIAQSGAQLVADRYSYLSCLVWALLAGAGIVSCWRVWRSSHRRRPIFLSVNGLAAAVVLLLGILTWKQTQVWQDSETLWRYVLEGDPESRIAHLNLGEALTLLGRSDEAMEHYRQALRIYPYYTEARLNLAQVLILVGESDKAMEQYREALELSPGVAEVHNSLANALLKQGKTEEAVEHYREALQIDPGHEAASNGLSSTLAQLGRLDEAIEQFRRSLKINPSSADTHYDLAKLLSQRGNSEEAIQHYREALKINPGDAEALNDLGVLLAQRGRLNEAVGYFQQALSVQPNSAKAYHNLGRAEAAQGNLSKAIDYFQRALHIEPEFAEAHENLARALALQGEKDEAVQHYQESLRIMKSRQTGPAASN